MPPDLRHITADELRPLAVPLESLTLDPNNERVHDRGNIDRIKFSLVELGVRAPIGIREEGQIVSRGNGNLMALRELAEERAVGRWPGAPDGPLSWDHVPILTFADDAEMAARYRILDNATTKDAVDDPVAIDATVAQWPDFNWEAGGWGKSAREDALAAWADVPDSGDGEDADEPEDSPIPEPPEDPVTQPGDIWTLGDHRVICGSCRDPEVVARLMDGEEINVAFTSPPYASQRKYDETSGFEPIKPDDYVEWFDAVQANVRAHLAEDGSWFVNIKEHCEDGERHLYVKDLTIAHKRKWGWRFVDELCWHKTGLPGKWATRLRNDWEPVLQFGADVANRVRHTAVAHMSKQAVRGTGGSPKTSGGAHGRDHAWTVEGLALPSNVLRISTSGSGGSLHSAAFPIALPTFFIKAYSDEGDAIYDPFMGSGTTIIAAEREERRGYGCEISPKYCDVIVERWETETGRKAERLS